MRARLILAALAVSTFLYVTTETLPIGLLPQIAGGLGVHPSGVGLLVTAYGLVVVLATIPLTRLTQRWPRRRLLTTVLLIATVATVVSALAPNYPVLLAGRIAAALSQALFWAVVTPAAAALFRPQVRGKAIGILYAGSSVAPLLGVPAGTWLGQQAGWRLPFLALAGLALTVSVVIVTLMPDLPRGTSDAERGTAPDAGRYRVVVAATAISVTGALTAFTCVTPYLTSVVGLDEAATGPVLLLRGAAGLLGAVLAGFLVQRYARHLMAVLVGVQALALAAQYLLADFVVPAVLAIAVAGLVLSGLTTVLGARVLEVAPAGTDLASAGMSTAFNVGITAGALLGSYLLAVADIRASALVAALISGVGLAVAAAEGRFARPQPRSLAGCFAHSPDWSQASWRWSHPRGTAVTTTLSR